MSVTANTFGLPSGWFERVIAVLSACPEVERIVVYGSRARGDFSPASDLDLAVDAPSLTHADFSRLHLDLDELPFILKIDLVWLQEAGEALRASILRDEKEAFRRQNAAHICQEHS